MKQKLMLGLWVSGYLQKQNGKKAACWDVENGVRRTYPWGEAALDSDRTNHDNVFSQTS